jgi:hypothetical protein
LLVPAGFVGYYERIYQRMGAQLDADVDALRRFRWERPVLRGPMGDGNAADEIYAALADWKPLHPQSRSLLADAVFHGQPLPAAEAAALKQRAPALHALRAAAQQRWSRTDLALERGTNMLVPDYPQLTEAGLSLLAEAQGLSADECLATATDVIRLGQDLVPAAALEATSTSTHLTSLASRVIVRCAQDADLGSLRRASHELRVLATHPAPSGSCIELQELAAAADLRQRAALSNKATPFQVARTLLDRPRLIERWAVHDNPIRFRQLSPERYPDAIEDWKHEQDFRTRSGFDEAAAASGEVLARLQDDMRGQAIVRMLSIGLSTLAERAYRGSLPAQPSGLKEAALADPYRGQPFNYRVASNGSELTLWSVGEDFRDDNGSDEWNGAAPRDVTLHVSLASRDNKPAAKRTQ